MITDNGKMINLPKLILASGSPRRAEILTSVGWEFEKVVADIDETEFAGENPVDYVQRLAKEKAEVVAADHSDRIVLGADTTVVIDNQIIGKPLDLDDARRMLRLLSGNWHEVLTGVAVVQNGETKVGLQNTRVKFADLSESAIEFLVRFGEPLDKAGAYAVQAQAALFIEGIEGDYWNVVGLPISLVYQLVEKTRIS
ncbi:MAG TPA: Maf family protein [Pyrinomonadaceae bacterium]|nr:Maf family protein [Pyrinomonadaceae bacterium]